jgi:hypothetical protein
VITNPILARKVHSTITTYKLGKSYSLSFIFLSYMRQNNTRLYVIFISLYFGLYVGLIVSEPHISPHKGSIRVYFSLESV